MKERRTLCPRCASDYRDAGYCVQRDCSVTIKEPCYLCGRMGWAYRIGNVWQRNGHVTFMHPNNGEK